MRVPIEWLHAYCAPDLSTFALADRLAMTGTEVERVEAHGVTALENFVVNADDAKLNSAASTLAHIGTHNAYHTGQILYVRKLQGSWNPENGVK